jgi:hypothetical protein
MTAREFFDFLWDEHGWGSAKSWAKAYMGPELADLWVANRRGRLKLPSSLTQT